MALPHDEVHRHLSQGSTYPVLPGPIITANNAFVQHDLLNPLEGLTGNSKSLLENLGDYQAQHLSLIHISEPTRLLSISYAVFCLKKKKNNIRNTETTTKLNTHTKKHMQIQIHQKK
eukprot:TRINITY_DN57678_c0_g1_i1.p2 TRINITY_DN57678_c0_g1~~TRINITY_DN57678_c0_g1_i1.p2  ORF type:complete len:117 (-),score=31.00 TRINITY_DN57678_c0_g1_i1:21-371(-)